MRRPGQEGGGDSGESVSGVLGLLHADGSPVTLADCTAGKERCRIERVAAAVALRGALKQGVEGDPHERASLVKAMFFSDLRHRVWYALERLARHTLEDAE